MERTVPRLSLGQKPNSKGDASTSSRLPSISDADDNIFDSKTSRRSSRVSTKQLSRRTSRSNVLLGAIKKDLVHRESNPAINKHRKYTARQQSERISREENIVPESRMSWPRDNKHRRRYSSIGALNSRVRRRSSVSSVSSNEYILSDQELRKINMLQTLQNMGINLQKRRSKLVHSPTLNEIDIIENMHLRRKHSLSTRMLEATKLIETKRMPSPTPLANLREVTEITDMSEMISSSDEVTKKISRPSSKESITSIGGIRGFPRHRASIAGTTVMEASKGFKRRLRRRKVKPIQKFKRIAKFILILLRSWRSHSQSVHEILLSFDNLDAVTRSDEENVDLLFDITDYKASKEAKISKEMKRILCKKPSDRTKDEVYYIQIALRNYQSIVEYPVHMQKLLAQRAWYESYDAKRIIVREGHVPMCFYFILTGSGVVSAMDRKTNVRKTVMYLMKGDSFGEQAIMTRSLRQTTVISREKIELLVISDTDFIDIFMSGGLRDPNDPFIRSIGFLSEWPVEMLAENPKKAIFSYFKRNTVLVSDSQKNDWIFIIKSGSCSILKRLEKVLPQKAMLKAAKRRTWRENIESALEQDKCLSHSDQLAILCEDEIKKLEEKNTNIHYYALPEINIATNAAYTQLREEHERETIKIINMNTITKAIHELENLNMDEEQIHSVVESSSTLKPPPTQKRRMSVHDLGNMLKPPHMVKPGNSASTERKAETTIYPDDETEQDDADEEEERPSTSDTRKDLPEDGESERQPLFVNVANLTKGQSFGLQDIVFDNQTSLSLISNGTEVIMINKKFFLDQLTTAQFVRLREKIFPYPTEEKLKQELTDMVTWDYHRKVTVLNSLRNAAIRKQNVNDARSYLSIPPVAV